jgi:hypothetical protein
MTSGERPPERAVRHALLRWSTASGQMVSSRGQVRSASPKRLAVTLATPYPAPEYLPPGQHLDLNLATTAGLATIPTRLAHYQPVTGLIIVTVNGSVGYIERRHGDRVALSLPLIEATLLNELGRPREQFQVDLCNLSEGGALFASPAALAVLEHVELVLPLDRGETIKPVLVVLECTHPSADRPERLITGELAGGFLIRGVFHALFPRDLLRLRDYVTRRQVAELSTFF